MNTIRFNQFNVLVFFLLYALLLVSCNKSEKTNTDLLDKAESVLEEHPDSAFLLISNIEHRKLTKEQLALYNLLTSAAIYKTYGSQSDSIILKAIRYFDKKKDYKYLLQSYYYLGCIYEDNQDILNALEYYQKAINLIEHSDNNLIIGKLYNNLGMLYAWQNMYDHAIPNLKQAITFNTKAGNIDGLAYSLRDLARAYSIVYESADSALHYYKDALIISNAEMRASMLSEIGLLYVKNKEFDKASICLQEAIMVDETKNDKNSTYIAYGALFIYTNKFDSARYYLKKALDSENNRILQGAYYYLTLTEEKANNFPEMSKMLKEYFHYHDKYEKDLYTEKIAHFNELYKYTRIKKEHAEAQLRYYKHIIVISVVAALLILTCTMLSFFLYRKNREIKTQKKRFKNWEKKYNTDKMEKKTYENIVRSSIYRKFHDNEGAWIPDSEDWIALSSIIDETHNNFTYNLNALLPTITSLEIKISYLIKIGISPGRIANLLSMTGQNVSMIRSRMFEKITKTKGSSSRFDELIKKM
jgi:tetratricopeptide (TPR) repeat protein